MPHSGLITPQETDLIPIEQESGWTQGLTGRMQKISPPLEFDPWTAHPVVSCYTAYTILAHFRTKYNSEMSNMI